MSSPRPQPLLVVFGEKLAKARQRAGLSQEELARRLKLGRSSISNIELGRQRPNLELLYAVAEVLRIRPSTLLPDPKTVFVPWSDNVKLHVAPDERGITENDRQQLASLVAEVTGRG